MSIKTHRGIRIIHCSFCEETAGSPQAEFRDCVDEWKEQGWRMFKKDDNPEWQHICPDCRDRNKLDYARRQENEGGDFD